MIVGYGSLPCFVPVLFEIENVFALFWIAVMVCETRFSSKVEEILEKRRGKAHHHRTRIFDLQTNEFEIRCKCRYASAYSAEDTI
jgi:hypothetical protein